MGDSQIKQELKCKIINTEPDPKHPGRQIVSIKINDGDPRGEYIRSFSLIATENPISLEKLALDLSKKDLSRPVDPFHYIKEAQESGLEFSIIPSKE